MKGFEIQPIIQMRILYLSLLLFIVPALASAQYVQVQEVFPQNRFQAPVEMQPVPGRPGKVALVSQSGFVRILDMDSTAAAPVMMLNLTAVTRLDNETGLLGLAFHPRYPAVNKIYVNYVANLTPTYRTVIASFTVDTATLIAPFSSLDTVITYAQPFSNHKGGKLQFGPDSMLYIAAGDGGSANDPFGNGQNKNVLLGKILRLDVDHRDSGRHYAIPLDNPFADSAAPVRGEIYAYGLRNPWRFSWDMPTRRLWVADVGQNLYEEIDTVISGGNYGWAFVEGYHCNSSPVRCATPGLIKPIFTYIHSAINGQAITGGYVYRGTAIPWLQGQYIYSDYTGERIWGLALGPDTLVTNTQLMPPTGWLVSSFGRAHDDELYIMDYNQGAVFKMVADPTAVRPALDKRIPQAYAYPNPASDEITVEIDLAQDEYIRLYLWPVTGFQAVVPLLKTRCAEGKNKLTLSTQNLSPGSYMLEMQADENTLRRRIMIAR